MNSIALVGFMGSGKTTIGQALSKRLNVTFMDTDALVESRARLSIPDIFNKYGEPYFRELEKNILKEVPIKNTVIATGGGIVLDQENRLYLKKLIVIWLDPPLHMINERLKNDDSRPLWKQSIKERRQLFEERRNLYKSIANIRIRVEQHSIEDIVGEIIRRI